MGVLGAYMSFEKYENWIFPPKDAQFYIVRSKHQSQGQNIVFIYHYTFYEILKKSAIVD